MPLQFNQVPPMDEVWKVGNTFYLVRFIENTFPPVPLIWKVSPGDVAALGIGRPTRTLSAEAFAKTGALAQGDSRELLNTTEDPWQQILSNYEKEVRVKPWLADPEMLVVWLVGALEDWTPGQVETAVQNTEWWRTHTDTERQWLSLNASDPATADRLIRDNQTQVADLFTQAGISNASQDLINAVSDNWTTGKWSQTYAVDQIRLLADPLLDGILDPILRSFGEGLDTTRVGEDDVRNMIQMWVGPAIAGAWSDQNVEIWASKFREDPDARIELVDLLKRQRLALFPEYENPNLSYEDIAAPWRGVWSQVWGQTPDEMDPLFTQIVRLNDLGSATQLLRKKGLEANNSTVSQNFLSDLRGAFGGVVQRADPAIL